MLYLGIDQHAKHLTVCIRNEQGDVVMRRQVSTKPEKVKQFFVDVQELVEVATERGFLAILEVCGFNDWLVEMLEEYNCCEVVMIQPEHKNKRKTDRRDAAQLSELLWVNRQRIVAGKRIAGLRRVQIPEPQDAEDRRLTTLRVQLGARRARTINAIKHLLRKHNLQWEMPTKTFPHTKSIVVAETRQLAKHRPFGDGYVATRPGQKDESRC